MNLSHKTKLYPNDKQVTYLRRACGIRRFAYNWALAESRKLHDSGTNASGYALIKRFTTIKYTEFPWVLRVTKWAAQSAIQDAHEALRRWWKGLAKAPQFKKKGKTRDSFYVGSTNFSIKGKQLRIDKCGQIRMAQELRFQCKPKFVTVSRDADEWFVSITVDLEEPYPYPHECETQDSVGVDVGISRLVTLSNGKYVDNPRYLRRYEETIKRLQRKLSRKHKGSNNYVRTKILLARAYRKLRRCRVNALHRITSYLVKNFRIIGIENLNVRGMVKNHKLAKHVADAGFYEFRRQLEYKAKLAGSDVVVVDRWFPSSKTCSRCGHVNPGLTLKDRTFVCPKCGLAINRDHNAAVNLQREALATVRDRKTVESRDTTADRRRRKPSNKSTERLLV